MGADHSIFKLSGAPDDIEREAPDEEELAKISSRLTENLTLCPDCQHECSTQAEACPSCGRFFRNYPQIIEVTPGAGWSMAVFWGIMLAWIIPMVIGALIGGVLVVALFVLGSGAAFLTTPRTPTTLNR